MKELGKRFTLIELLFVITVIVILAALLLPALSKAKERAYSIRCLGQLRQTGIAVLQYGNDHGNYRPPLYNPGTVVYWAKILVLDGYISNTQTNSITQCPSAQPSAQDSSYNKSYGMIREAPYRGVAEVLQTTMPYRIDKSVYPSEDPMLGDSIRINPAPVNIQVFTAYKIFNPAGTFQLQLRHSNTANIFFYDGSAGGLTLSKIKNLKTYNVPLSAPYGGGDFCVIDKNYLPITWPSN